MAEVCKCAKRVGEFLADVGRGVEAIGERRKELARLTLGIAKLRQEDLERCLGKELRDIRIMMNEATKYLEREDWGLAGIMARGAAEFVVEDACK